MGSRMPYGTAQCSRQDVDRGILVSIQNKSACGTDMRPGRERFPYTFSTVRTVLASVLWGNTYHFYPMHDGIGLDPTEESSPRCIVDTLGKDSTIDLQALPGDALFIHPQTQALVPNELAYSYSFLNRCILFLGAI